MTALTAPTDTQTARLIGLSAAGVGTAIMAPAFGVQFDCGVHLRNSPDADVLCITHAHPDHVSDLLNFLAVRQMRASGRPDPLILLSAATMGAIAPMMESLRLMCPHTTPTATFQVCAPGDTIRHPGRRDIVIRVLHADHVAPCQGYLICEERRTLNPLFAGMSGAEIAQIARQRDPARPVNVTRLIGLAGYSGDTTHRWFDLNRSALAEIDCSQAEIAVECSYTADSHRERAVTFGHMHSTEFIAGVASMPPFIPVPVHFSLRTTSEERAAVIAAASGQGARSLTRAEIGSSFPL